MVLLTDQRYIQTPWTRDSQVRANIVGMAPRVSGPIVQVAVHDNQVAKKGDRLFEIDPTDFHAQLDLANGQVQNAEANFKQQKNRFAQYAFNRAARSSTFALKLSLFKFWVFYNARFDLQVVKRKRRPACKNNQTEAH